MPKLDLKNTVFTGKYTKRASNNIIEISDTDKARLGLKGNSRIYVKNISLPMGLRIDDQVGVLLERDAFDYKVKQFTSINGISLLRQEPQTPHEPSP